MSCKSIQGSELQAALGKVQEAARAAKDLQGLERQEKWGLSWFFYRLSQQSAALGIWEDSVAENSIPKSNYAQ